MAVAQRIAAALSRQFQPTFLDVLNESASHAVPKGSETHFKVVVVSAAFEGVPLIARHRQINAALAQELASGVHALQIVAKTPSQWQENCDVPESPKCLGGSKHDKREG